MSRIVIDENRCKGCGLCTTACPFGLIRIADRFNAKGYHPAEYAECPSERADNSTPGKQCTGCTNCAAMCPDVAITVYRSRANGRPRTSAHAGKQAVRQTGAPADQQINKKNGRERQPVHQTKVSLLP